MEKNKSQQGFIPIALALIATAIGFLILFVLYGGAMGIVQLFARNFLGADTGFGGSGCGGSTGAVTCPSGTLANLPKSSSNIARINKNMDFYKEIADKMNVPWEVVAAIQYRESTNSTDRTRSWSNGEKPLCNKIDNTYVNFKKKYGHECQSAVDDAIGAIDHLQEKVSNRLRKDVWDEDLIKRALFGFNGAAERYKDQAVALGFPRNPGYDGSPYVMANFDERRAAKKYKKCCVNKCKIYDYCEGQDGAFTVASLLKNAEYGPDGKIVSLGGCKAVQGATTTTNTACASTTSVSLAGQTGPVIPGQFYPPYGDNMKKATPHRAANPHGPPNHGVFPASTFRDGFRDSANDGAIDYNIPASSDQPIYAPFDGTVYKTKYMHISKTKKKYGGIMWMKSTDGNNAAIFAHFEFAEGIQRGRVLKKGEVVGRVAKKCGHGTTQCVQFGGSIHLHYQLYINKQGQSRQQLLQLFPLS